MTDRSYFARVNVVRKPDPEAPPPYTCAICRETIAMSGTEYNWPRPEFRKGPVCQRCAFRWGYSNCTRRFHTSERDKGMKLAAVIEALTWEILNGNGRWKKWGNDNACH